MQKQDHGNQSLIKTLLACLLISLVQGSCHPKRRSERIIIASAGKIKSIDPAQANTFNSLQLISALGDTLYRIDANGNLIPRLAKNLPLISDKGLTISIPLREDVLFHDGTPFNSQAMAFSLKRFKRIGTLNYVLAGRIAAIETPSPFVLRLRLTRPSSSLRGLLTSINLTPLSPKAYANYTNKYLNKKFVGTGPYLLKNFHPQHQRLVPFNLYWDKPPKNSGVDFINLSNSTALYGALKSGEVDVLLSTSIDENQRQSLNQSSKKGTLIEGEGPALEIGYITFHTNSSPLNNSMIRQALIHSLDRNLISRRVSYGLREPLRSLIPPSLKNRESSPWPRYNPNQAKDLLKKAGFCSGSKLNIPLTFRSNVPADKLLALTWQAQVNRDLPNCLQLKLNGVESTTIYRQLGEGAFQAVILDWRGAYPDPEAYLSPLLSCAKIKDIVCEKGEAAISGSFWGSPKVKKLLDQSEELFGDARMEKLIETDRYAAEGFAYLPVWLVKPRAWAQIHLNKPEFDGAGQLLINRLSNKNQ